VLINIENDNFNEYTVNIQEAAISSHIL